MRRKGPRKMGELEQRITKEVDDIYQKNNFQNRVTLDFEKNFAANAQLEFEHIFQNKTVKENENGEENEDGDVVLYYQKNFLISKKEKRRERRKFKIIKKKKISNA